MPRARGTKNEHVLTDVSKMFKRAVCQKCGPVGIVFYGDRYYCEVAKARRSLYNKGPHGLTYFEVANMVALIGACEICGKEAKRMGVDHNHATGQVRGVLCTSCNFLVGVLEKAPARVQVATEYLLYWNNKEG